MILVDTNIVVPLVVLTANTDRCRALHQHDPDWHLADWWQIEFANVLRNFRRADQLKTNDALRAMDLGRSIFATANTHPVDLIETLRIACDSKISAYDARFIALARSLGQKLVTEDARLRNACPADTLSLDDALAAFP